jgi:hypothetical protein
LTGKVHQRCPGRLDRPDQLALEEVHATQSEQRPGALDRLSGDREQHGRPAKEPLGIVESVLIHPEGTLQVVDPGEDLRIGDSLVRDHRADILEVAVGLLELNGGPAGVRNVCRGQSQQAHTSGATRRVLNDPPGKLRQMLGFLRKSGHHGTAFLEKNPGDLRTPIPRPRALDPGGPLLLRQGEELRHIPLCAVLVALKILQMAIEHRGDSFDAGPGALALPFGLLFAGELFELSPAMRADRFQMLQDQALEDLNRDLAPRDRLQQLTSDVHVRHAVASSLSKVDAAVL